MATASSHPLEATLERGRARTHDGCHLGAALGATTEAGWTPVARLLGDARVLDDALAAVGREVGSPRRDVQASLLLESYAWQLALPLAGALVAESRMPMPGPGGTALLLTGGRPRAIRLLHGFFVALPDDPATGHIDADVVADQSVLDLCLRSALITHFEPFVQILSAASGRSRRALWRTVADRTATALLYAGLASNRTAVAHAAAERALAPHPPYTHPPRYSMIGEQPVHLRHGCCLWWRTTAATTCLTCPLRVSPLGMAPCRARKGLAVRWLTRSDRYLVLPPAHDVLIRTTAADGRPASAALPPGSDTLLPAGVAGQRDLLSPPAAPQDDQPPTVAGRA